MRFWKTGIWERGQGNTDPPTNNAPTANFTGDFTTDVNTEKFVYAASSTDVDGDPIVASQVEFTSRPGGSAAALVAAGPVIGGVNLGWKYTGDVAGTYHRRVRVQDDGGAARGIVSPTPLWSDWKERVDTFVGGGGSSQITVDLNAHEAGRLIPYNEYGKTPPADATTCFVVNDAGTDKLRVNIFGDEGSRNGAGFTYLGSAMGGEWDDFYICYKIQFHAGWRFLGAPYLTPSHQSGGGGKVGVAIFANAPGFASGGGDFNEGSCNFRIIYEAHNETSKLGRLKLYLYVPYWNAWMEAEAADIIDNIPLAYAFDSYSVRRCNFNHWEMGGDRGATGANETGGTPPAGYPRHPGATTSNPNKRTAKGAKTGLIGVDHSTWTTPAPVWTQWGQSRYVGKTGILPTGAAPWTFPYGGVGGSPVIEIQQYFKMNTLDVPTFQGGVWMTGGASPNSTYAKPKKDGIYKLWARLDAAAPELLISVTNMVMRYPKYPTLKFNRIDPGGAAGGGFENCDGTFDVWDVRLSPDPIIAGP